jgi:hypothetical protein
MIFDIIDTGCLGDRFDVFVALKVDKTDVF